MARDEGAGAGSILLAFLVGAVAGAAVALLYAPTTGDEARRFLGERAREGRDRAAEAAAKGLSVLPNGSGVARVQVPAPGAVLHPGESIRVQFVR